MMVSSKGRYALRVMIYLAQNDREELIPLKEIAENQNISMKYLEMIVSLLHKGNMLISGRGKKEDIVWRESHLSTRLVLF